MRSLTLKATAVLSALALVILVASGFRGGADRSTLPKGTISVGLGNNLTVNVALTFKAAFANSARQDCAFWRQAWITRSSWGKLSRMLFCHSL